MSANNENTTPDSAPETLVENTFTNEQVFAHHITTDSLDMQSLSPKYRRINMLFSSILGALIIALIVVVFSGLFFDPPKEANTIILASIGVVLFLTLWSVIYHFYADPLKKYALREHDLNFQSGLIFKSLVSQPILRIQHIEIKRGPIERRAGLATLQVFSAGGVTYTFNIPGLVHENAIELRQFILDHKDLASDV